MTNTEKDIREWMKNHHARTSLTGDDVTGEIETAIWKNKNGSSTYYTQYTCLRKLGILIATGDSGDAIFQWHGANPGFCLKWASQCELDYFASKCLASPYGRGFRSFDPEAAKKSLIDMVSDENPDLLGEFMAEILDFAYEFEMRQFLDDYGEKYLGSHWWESCGNIGMEIDIQCRIMLVGLKMMAERGEI